MSSWSTIRKATSEDKAKLNAAARRFAERHDIGVLFHEAGAEAYDLECCLMMKDIPDERLSKLWTAIVRRTLGSKAATGIAYGYVGFSVK